ncbi:HNH endonuclease signature motif containing protein [Microbacterium paludicola]|uniref:HNH endonuclease signature motif containing protein n=1 Tax=Microbacterium paludicola TaxID=300019 RepID=UPI0031E2C4A1
MDFLTELRGRVDAVTSFSRLDAEAASALRDDDVVGVLQAAAELVRAGQTLQALVAVVAAARSRREAGHDGLAQSRGHRNTVEMVQELSGGSKADAARQVRLGQVLLEGLPGSAAPDAEADVPVATWHDPLDRALLDGAITAPQSDAILRGLGVPPEDGAEVWRVACEQLLREVPHRTVEELRLAAQCVRDELDPEGAEERFLARFERRAFRMWTDADGVQRASLVCDDEGGAFLRAVIDAAMRPRRGGPRFVDSAERERAKALVDDPRSNDQLAYDMMMDVLRAGAVADAEKVFGTRQPGVRVVVVKDAPVGHTEDGGHPLPAPAIEQAICTTGVLEVTVDSCGNPLDVGREQRLFTPKQRIALAVRDGGCMWPGCATVASYCEAHHIDEWAAHGGRTDVGRGVLLCRFHHMNLHHRRHRITRTGAGAFMLHPPDGPPVELRPNSPRRWMWNPPPRAA